MLGVRVTFNTPATLAWLSDGTADWFWPAAEKAGVPVMFLAFGHVSKFAPIAQRHPGLPLIIDHMGVKTRSRRRDGRRRAIGDAVALAEYPNVSIKMSNLVNSSLEPYPFRDLNEPPAPGVRRLRAAALLLGDRPDRRLRPGDLAQRIAHFTEELTFMSESDKDWVMGRAIRAQLKWA